MNYIYVLLFTYVALSPFPSFSCKIIENDEHSLIKIVVSASSLKHKNKAKNRRTNGLTYCRKASFYAQIFKCKNIYIYIYIYIYVFAT